jgi:hypothetical protein
MTVQFEISLDLPDVQLLGTEIDHVICPDEHGLLFPCWSSQSSRLRVEETGETIGFGQHQLKEVWLSIGPSSKLT